MKKLFLYLFVLFVFTSCASLLNLDGNKFYVDGVTYKLTEDKTSVFVVYDDRYNQQSEIYIPKEIVVKGKTYPVAFIEQDFFRYRPRELKVVIEEYIWKPNDILRNVAGWNVTIKHVIFSDSLTIIPQQVFGGITVESVTIPNSVTKIDYKAFYENECLTSVTIGNSVTKIGDESFDYCKSLTSLTIPKSVINLYDRDILGDKIILFKGCTGLSSIIVEKGNPRYDSRDNCNAIIDTRKNKLIKGCNNTVIPYSVEIIGNRALENCHGLTEIEIPNSVKSIEFLAFNNCEGLTSVTIPSSVKEIEFEAFQGCNLTKVTFEGSCYLGDRAFNNNPLLSDVSGSFIDSNENAFYCTPFGDNYSREKEKRRLQEQKEYYEKHKDDNKKELAALKKQIGLSTYNTLQGGYITKGMKLSSIQAYRDYLLRWNYVYGAQIIDKLPNEVTCSGLTFTVYSSNAYSTTYAFLFSNRRGGDMSGGYFNVQNGIVQWVNMEHR